MMVLLVLLVILLLACLSQLWLSGFLIASRMMLGKALDNAEECSVFSFFILTFQFFTLC